MDTYFECLAINSAEPKTLQLSFVQLDMPIDLSGPVPKQVEGEAVRNHAQINSKEVMAAGVDPADVHSYRWKKLPDMPTGRVYSAGGYHKEKLYIIGKTQPIEQAL